MKITRQNLSGKSRTNAAWLNDFASNLQKNAENIDYLKDYLNKNKVKKVFNSIDEKLADIKERIGFDLAINVSNEMEKISSSSCKCNDGCGCSIKTAAQKNSPQDISIMSNILKYIEDMVRHEPNIDLATVLYRCRYEENLKYSLLESKIDKQKLSKYISDLIGIKKDEMFSYSPLDGSSDSQVNSENNVAEYYNHAEPKTS